MFKNFFILVSVGVLFFCLAVPGFTADTIKIGAPVPLTGYFAGDGTNYLNGIKMAVDEINGKGGLLGKKIEIATFDTQDLAPERVMLAADQLVGKEKVASIHCGWGGWGQDVMAYGKYDVPAFLLDASIATDEMFRKDPVKYHNIFQFVDVEKVSAILQFGYMTESIPYEYPSKTVAVITTDDSWGTESGTGTKNRAKEKGWEVVVDEIVPYGTTNWGPIMTKIRKENPGWIYIEIISVPDQVAFIREFLKKPTRSLIHVGYVPSLIDFAPNIGKDGNGIFGVWPPPPGPEYPTQKHVDYVNKYKEKFNLTPAGSSFSTYDGVMTWAKAVEAVGDETDYKAINDYLENNEFEMLCVMGEDGKGMGRLGKGHLLTMDQTLHSLAQLWDGTMHSLFLRGGEKYKYDFKMPPWVK